VPGTAREIAGRVRLLRVEDVEQVVRDRAALGECRLRGADIEPAVRLQGVRVDQLVGMARSPTRWLFSNRRTASTASNPTALAITQA
jgi:hypothetical protein